MGFYDLIQLVINDTLDSLPVFLPELILCLTIFVLLLARVVLGRIDISFYWTLAGLLIALVVPYGGQPWRILRASDELLRQEIFTGMLVYDGFTLFMRGLLIAFAILLILLIRLTNIFDRRDGTDVYTLILGATLGMCLMASANHLLMVFLAVEMASVPSYVLAGFRKTRRVSSEAALKYSVYGAGTAGVMLYGIDAATARNASDFLKVTIPAKLMYSPSSRHSRAVTADPVNECMTPDNGPRLRASRKLSRTSVSQSRM